MYAIRNKKTKEFVRIIMDYDDQGSCYESYRVAYFELERADQYNAKSPIFVTTSKEIAEEIVRDIDKRSEKGTIERPSFNKYGRRWNDEGTSVELYEYEIAKVEVK